MIYVLFDFNLTFLSLINPINHEPIHFSDHVSLELDTLLTSSPAHAVLLSTNYLTHTYTTIHTNHKLPNTTHYQSTLTEPSCFYHDEYWQQISAPKAEENGYEYQIVSKQNRGKAAAILPLTCSLLINFLVEFNLDWTVNCFCCIGKYVSLDVCVSLKEHKVCYI